MEPADTLDAARREREAQINSSAAMAQKSSMDDKIAMSKQAFIMPSYLLPPAPKKPVEDPNAKKNDGNSDDAKSGNEKSKSDKSFEGCKSSDERTCEQESPNSKGSSPGSKKPKKLYQHRKPDLPDVSELAQITELECGCKCDVCIDYYKKCVVMRDQLYAAQNALRGEKFAMQETINMVKEYEVDNKQKLRDLDIDLIAEKGKTKSTLEAISKERKVHLDTVYKLHNLEEQYKQLEAENMRCMSSISLINKKVEKLQLEKLHLAEKLESVNKSNMNAFTELHKYEMELARLEENNNFLRCQLSDIDKVSGGQIQKIMYDHHVNSNSHMMTKSILKGVPSGRNQQQMREQNRDGSMMHVQSGLRQSTSSHGPSIAQKAALANLGGENSSVNRSSVYNDLVANTNRAMNEKPSLLMQYSKGYK